MSPAPRRPYRVCRSLLGSQVLRAPREWPVPATRPFSPDNLRGPSWPSPLGAGAYILAPARMCTSTLSYECKMLIVMTMLVRRRSYSLHHRPLCGFTRPVHGPSPAGACGVHFCSCKNVGWISCPRFATSEQERRCTRAQRAPEGRGPGWPEFHAPSDVGVSTSSVASTNLEQDAGDPWVAPTMSIPQTGAHARRTAGMRAPRPKGEGQDGPRKISGLGASAMRSPPEVFPGHCGRHL